MLGYKKVIIDEYWQEGTKGGMAILEIPKYKRVNSINKID